MISGLFLLFTYFDMYPKIFGLLAGVFAHNNNLHRKYVEQRYPYMLTLLCRRPCCFPLCWFHTLSVSGPQQPSGHSWTMI